MIEIFGTLIVVALFVFIFFGFSKSFLNASNGIKDVFEVMSKVSKNITNKATQFPLMEGRILKAEMVQTERGHYKSLISFEYIVSGKEYISKNDKVGYSTADKLQVENYLRAFVEGAIVRLYVNPADPNEAYLESEIKMLNQVSDIFDTDTGDDSESQKPIKCVGCGSYISRDDKICQYCSNPTY